MTQFSIIGLRFDHLPPSEHAQFAFNQKQILGANAKIKKMTQSTSVMTLCTCDRVEVWCERPKRQIIEPCLRALSLPVLTWAKHTYVIEADQFLLHLCSLACGLLSPLFGENQIISQLDDSLSLSRLGGCASSTLEYLVREAITLAKRVQSTIDLQVVDDSIADGVYAQITNRQARSVLVIGSSALSRLISAYLAQKGMQVWMTFRDLEKADFLLPKGVQAVAYEHRCSFFNQVDVIVSATKGMEYTITKEMTFRSKLLFDLAGVRDIDPELPMPVLRIEDLKVALPKRMDAQRSAMCMIDEQIQKMHAYLAYRPQVEDIQSLGIQASNDLLYRLNSVLQKHHVDDELRNILYESARKAFTHQLYEQHKKVSQRTMYDLTECLVAGASSYAGDPDTSLEPFHTLEENGWNLTRLSFGSHTSTHMDSPSHLLKDGKTLDKYPLSRFHATAFVLDCSKMEAIGIDDLPSLEYSYDAILFFTGKPDKGAYLKIDAGQKLLERGVRLFGFDRPNCDQDGDADLPLHHLILESDALIIENLTNLEPILGKVVSLTCLPLLYRDADGAPARVVASLA